MRRNADIGVFTNSSKMETIKFPMLHQARHDGIPYINPPGPQGRPMTMNGTMVMGGCRWPLPFLPHLIPYLFRPDPKPEKVGGDPVADPQDKTVAATRSVIVCRKCLHEITSHEQRKVVNGAHVHTFANPEGIIFEIACYRDAWGCGYLGPSSPEFTWFAGYVWRIVICANCHVHLGWRFSALEGHFFHGLITSRLMTTGG